MATGGRKTQLQLLHQISRTINYNDTGVSSGLAVGVLPSGARLLRIQTVIETAFNAGTTNTISVGTTAGGTDLVNATAAGSAALTTTACPAAKVVQAADQTIYASYAQSGTAASAGVATIICEYLAAVG